MDWSEITIFGSVGVCIAAIRPPAACRAELTARGRRRPAARAGQNVVEVRLVR